MQIVPLGDNLHEIPDPIFQDEKKNINLSSAKFVYSVLSVLKTLKRAG